MTDYLPITDAETDPGAPGTSELWKKWRDNPIAIAEGATGAPRVQGIALGGVYLGSFTQDGKSPQALLGLDKVGLLVADVITTSTASSSGGGIVQISLSANGGASYGGWITLYTEPGTTTNSRSTGRLHLDLATGDWRVRMLASDGSVRITDGTLTLPAGVNAIQLTKANDNYVTVYDWFVLGSRD